MYTPHMSISLSLSQDIKVYNIYIYIYIHRCNTLQYMTCHAIHYMILHYIALHYITITLHYIALHCIDGIALHYIASHIYIYIYIYIYTYIFTHIYIYSFLRGRGQVFSELAGLHAPQLRPGLQDPRRAAPAQRHRLAGGGPGGGLQPGRRGSSRAGGLLGCLVAWLVVGRHFLHLFAIVAYVFCFLHFVLRFVRFCTFDCMFLRLCIVAFWCPHDPETDTQCKGQEPTSYRAHIWYPTWLVWGFVFGIFACCG